MKIKEMRIPLCVFQAAYGFGDREMGSTCCSYQAKGRQHLSGDKISQGTGIVSHPDCSPTRAPAPVHQRGKKRKFLLEFSVS